MVTNSLVQVPAGRLVDRIGRKPVLIGSRLAFSALAFLLFVNVGPHWLLTLLRCAQGVSGGAYTPALRAALADLTPAEQRGEQYARLQAVEMVGLLVGPAIGGAVAVWTYSAVFLCAGVGALLGVTALIRMAETRHVGGSKKSGEALAGWWRRRAIVVPSVALFGAGMMFSMYDTVWPQYMSSRHFGPFLIGISISLFALPVMVLTTAAGRFSDRGNRRPMIIGAFLLIACTASLYPELFSFPVIVGVGLVEAVGFMIIEPNLFAVVSGGAPDQARGRAMGVGSFFKSSGDAVGAGGLGALYGLAPAAPFWSGAGACVCAALTCALWLPTVVAQPSSEMPQAGTTELEAQL